MAIFTPGIAVGQISGRVGGNVFSHNRGGAYVRNGSIPTNPSTPYRDAIRAYLSAASQAWLSLTATQKAAWNEFALTRSWTNRLGRSISLNGQQTYIQLNARIISLGASFISVPPLTDPPNPIGGVTLTCDIGAGDFELAWTSGAIAANCVLYLRGCVVHDDSITYVRNLLRHFYTSSAAATTPQDIESAAATRFGTIQVGQVFHCEYRVISTLSGLQSSIFTTKATVTTT